MRILILGAGATGGYFGALLAKAGVDVTFLVRPGRREQLNDGGLRIKSHLGDVTTPVVAVTQDEMRGAFDAVILSSKAYGLAGAIDAIRPAVGDETLILPLLNGMRHLDDLDAAFGIERVLGGTCHISVALDADGTIRHLSPFGTLTLGPRTDHQRMGGGAGNLLGEILRGDIVGLYSSDIIGAMWEKWFFLATLAGATCLMRASVGEIVRTGEGQQFITRMLEECAAVAEACGHAPQEAARANALATLTDRQSNISASMLRDIQRGAKIEGDHIVGDLIRRGREHGVPTPLLDVAYVHLQAYQDRMNEHGRTA